MSKSYYFPHNHSTRSDSKIKNLIFKHGMLGYGIYWSIVEDLYMNANAMPLQCDCIAYELRVDIKIVESILNDFDLFQIENDFFSSNAVQKRIEEIEDRSKSASDSAKKRWNGNKKDLTDANAMRTQCDGNAIKEINEIKEINKIIINSKELKPSNKKHSFENSIYFDKKIFKEEFPDWERDKLAKYYESALLYSQSKGVKYLNWAAAIKNWEKRDNQTIKNGKSEFEKNRNAVEQRIRQADQYIAEVVFGKHQRIDKEQSDSIGID